MSLRCVRFHEQKTTPMRKNDLSPQLLTTRTCRILTMPFLGTGIFLSRVAVFICGSYNTVIPLTHASW